MRHRLYIINSKSVWTHDFFIKFRQPKDNRAVSHVSSYYNIRFVHDRLIELRRDCCCYCTFNGWHLWPREKSSRARSLITAVNATNKLRGYTASIPYCCVICITPLMLADLNPFALARHSISSNGFLL